MSAQLLQIKDLSVKVEDKEILHNVDLNLNKGETHVLMGPNGAGKSTLGYALMGNPRYEITDGHDTYLGNRTALRGESSDLESDIGYLLGGESRLDMNLEAVHTGKKTNSRMDVAGVLSGKAVKIFRGTIDFQKGCAGSVGNEKEDVLLLDDTIVNQTIPLILCNEEDVEGNHGATIGKLDEELLLYLESRGISEEAVYAMMAQARIDSICHKISDEEMKKKVQEYLEGEREE